MHLCAQRLNGRFCGTSGNTRLARGGPPSQRQTPCEFASLRQGQQFLRGPERHCRRAWARAFQTDFPQMQLGGTEVRVGRIVLVEAAHGRIAEKHAPATVRLETVFVWIDDDGIRLTEPSKSLARRAF